VPKFLFDILLPKQLIKARGLSVNDLFINLVLPLNLKSLIMKRFKLLSLFAILLTVSVFSQETTAFSEETSVKLIKPEPMFVIMLSDSDVVIQQSFLEHIKIDWIQSITVFKDLDSKEIIHYGKPAENGLVMVYIKKENESAFKELILE
jgi:hypothetical protein